MSRVLFCAVAALGFILVIVGALEAAEKTEPVSGTSAEKPPEKKLSKDPPGMKRLAPQYDVWIDAAHKRVVMDGAVVLTRGQLELFACIKGTKEHEAIVSVDTKAYIVHAALLAVGAKQGSPAQFQPTYKPASGTQIDVTVIWTDKAGKVQRVPAQNWIRDVKTRKEMTLPWVFGGSGFWQDSSTSQTIYLAEGGDFICVSNFSSAMLDVPVESTQANTQLQFEAFTERIPPLDTKVRLVLTPKLDKQAAAQKAK